MLMLFFWVVCFCETLLSLYRFTHSITSAKIAVAILIKTLVNTNIRRGCHAKVDGMYRTRAMKAYGQEVHMTLLPRRQCRHLLPRTVSGPYINCC